MDKIDFEQKKILAPTRLYCFTDKSLLVETKGLTKKQSFEYHYSTIPDTYTESTVTSRMAFFYFILFGGIGLFAMIIGTSYGHFANGMSYLLGAVPFGLYLWATRISYLVYNCDGAALLFYKDKPDELELDTFLGDLQKRKKAFLKENYLNAPTESLATELQKLFWLKESGAITTEEFEKLKKDVIDNSENQKNKVGF
jgi:hypothetical protein